MDTHIVQTDCPVCIIYFLSELNAKKLNFALDAKKFGAAMTTQPFEKCQVNC